VMFDELGQARHTHRLAYSHPYPVSNIKNINKFNN